MPSLKDMRVRLASTKATQKITKAMQMVAASKLRRATVAAEAVAALCGAHGEGAWQYRGIGRRQSGRAAASRRHRPGSCAFAPGVHRRAWIMRSVQLGDRAACPRSRQRASCRRQAGEILLRRRKGFEQLRRQFESRIIEMVDLRAVRQIRFEDADAIGRKVVALFEAGDFDVLRCSSRAFARLIAQIPTAQQLIPAVFPPAAAERGGAVYEYEPDEEDILAELLPRNISVQIFRALMENMASFYGAQMTAMDNATRNAGEMIRKQTLTYNRTRQAMITKELIEIISGAEAV